MIRALTATVTLDNQSKVSVKWKDTDGEQSYQLSLDTKVIFIRAEELMALKRAINQIMECGT